MENSTFYGPMKKKRYLSWISGYPVDEPGLKTLIRLVLSPQGTSRDVMSILKNKWFSPLTIFLPRYGGLIWR